MKLNFVISIIALSTMLALSALAQAQSPTGLVNPSFEEPSIGNEPHRLAEKIPGWQTTDTHFEIWGPQNKRAIKAKDGKQFAELNAYKDGTLYQESKGIEKGAVIEFSFAHRGRNGDDTMKLSITDLGTNNQVGGGDDTVLFTKQYTTGKSDLGCLRKHVRTQDSRARKYRAVRLQRDQPQREEMELTRPKEIS